jgi:nitrogenase molybdenum-iron protein alpha/beta subunit
MYYILYMAFNLKLNNVDFGCAPLVTEGFNGSQTLGYMCKSKARMMENFGGYTAEISAAQKNVEEAEKVLAAAQALVEAQNAATAAAVKAAEEAATKLAAAKEAAAKAGY